MIYDNENDKDKTDNWFDEDSEDEPEVNSKEETEEDSEDDYMKMDLSKL